jgi:hypothetical protein
MLKNLDATPIGPVLKFNPQRASHSLSSHRTQPNVKYIDATPSLHARPEHEKLLCCPPGCVQLSVVAGGGIPPYTYIWSPAGPPNQIINVCPTTNTTYTVTVTDSVGCTTTTLPHTVTICNKLVVASAGTNVTTCPGGQVTIGGSPTASLGTGPYTYSWSPATGLNSTTIANPTASPGQTTTYTVTVTDATGCQSTSTVTVTVQGPNCARSQKKGSSLIVALNTYLSIPPNDPPANHKCNVGAWCLDHIFRDGYLRRMHGQRPADSYAMSHDSLEENTVRGAAVSLLQSCRHS